MRINMQAQPRGPRQRKNRASIQVDTFRLSLPVVSREASCGTVRFCHLLCCRGDAYLICSPSELPKVRMLLSAVAAADSSGSSARAAEGGNNAVTSCLRGQHLCRFFLEAVHVLLPLVRPPTEDSHRGARSAFVDLAAILLHCSLRGHQVFRPISLRSCRY